MITFRIARTFVVALWLICTAAMADAKTMTYPTVKDALFTLELPAGWEGEPADEEGGFMNITGPTGILVSLRTVQQNEYTIEALMQEARDFLTENYTGVKFAAPTDNGKGGHGLGGIGYADGKKQLFVNSWTKAGDRFLELRIAADFDDDPSVEQAIGILDTVRDAK